MTILPRPRFDIRSSRLAFLVLLTLAGLAGAPPPARGQSDIVRVSSGAQLIAAIEAAQPGQIIQLLPAGPNDYDLPNKVVIGRAGRADAPITLRADAIGEPTLRFLPAGGIVEGFLVRAPYWTFENLDLIGLCFEDSHSRCEHAFHIVGAADHTTVRNTRMLGFNAQIKGNGEDGPGGRQWPDDVLIEGSEFYNATPRNTGNPVTPIDVVGGRRWIIRANYIHDFAKAGGNGISYAAFLKGNSRDGLFERNLVVCEDLHKGQIRLGLSFGGGGSNPDPICEDGTCTPEHRGGIMRNNIIANCPADVGIYLNEAADSQVHHNLLYNTGGGIDLRFAASSVSLSGNLMSGRIRERDGGKATASGNLENVSEAQFEDWFLAPKFLDFALKDGAAFVNKGQPLAAVPDDFCGNPRDDGAPDWGAVEYAEGRDCDTTRAHAIGPGAGPTEPATVEPTATAVEPTLTLPSPTVTPTPIFDFLIGGRVYDGGTRGTTGLAEAWVEITGCDRSTLRFAAREDGSYGGGVPIGFMGCPAWDYRVGAAGFRQHRERVLMSEVQDKDFRLFRAPLYLPLLVNRTLVRP